MISGRSDYNFGSLHLPPPSGTGSDSTDDDNSDEETDDSKLPKTNPNPLDPAGDSMDTLVHLGINADIWQQMQGSLPCLDADTKCIAQLQAIAVQKNPLLKEIDSRIQEINQKIEEAKVANKKSINLSVFRPAAQVFLQPTISQYQPPHHRGGGVLGTLASIFIQPAGIINQVLQAVGMPLFDSMFGGSDQNQTRAIAISDLAVKLAELQRGRAELADKVKEKIAIAVFDFDESRREFQISSEVSKREISRMQLVEVEYRLGQGSSETYLQQLSSLDKGKASTWKSWSAMRSRLERIKLLIDGGSIAPPS